MKKMDILLTLKINSFLSQELQGVSYVYRILCTMGPHPCLNLQSNVVRKEQQKIWYFQPMGFFSITET